MAALECVRSRKCFIFSEQKYRKTVKVIYYKIQCIVKAPRHFSLDKIICEHLYELVITIAKQHVLLTFHLY